MKPLSRGMRSSSRTARRDAPEPLPPWQTLRLRRQPPPLPAQRPQVQVLPKQFSETRLVKQPPAPLPDCGDVGTVEFWDDHEFFRPPGWT